MITREQLNNKSIDKLDTIEEAFELIRALTYTECITCLKEVKRMPATIQHALVEQAKKTAGRVTFEIIEAAMQASIN